MLRNCGKPSEDGGVKQDTTALEWYPSSLQPPASSLLYFFYFFYYCTLISTLTLYLTDGGSATHTTAAALQYRSRYRTYPVHVA